MLLSDVALGQPSKVWKLDDLKNAKKTDNSIWVVGKDGPDPSATVTMSNGVAVPAGKVIELKDYDPKLKSE